MIALPMPSLLKFDIGESVEPTLLEQSVLYIDKSSGLITIGELGYGKRRRYIYVAQLICFLEMARMVLSSSVYAELIAIDVDGNFFVRTGDNHVIIAGIRCDARYATSDWLDTLKRIQSEQMF